MAEFNEKYGSEYKNFKLDYVQGAPPSLILYDDDGAEVDKVGIGNWKTESIKEYLDEKLAK